jgi:hypothetical protein
MVHGNEKRVCGEWNGGEDEWCMVMRGGIVGNEMEGKTNGAW